MELFKTKRLRLRLVSEGPSTLQNLLKEEVAPMSSLSMDELARAAQLGVKYATEQVSFRDVLVMSYEGGGVYPTLVGYVLGAIATLCFARCSSWMSCLIPTALCIVLFMYTYAGLERRSLEWLLMVATATGVCCTYVQLASLDLIQEHFAFKKLSKAKAKQKKRD